MSDSATEFHRSFRNNADDHLAEALGGLVAAHPDAEWHEEGFIAHATGRDANRVAVLSGGGSGHEPLHAGFVGAGMLDAAVPGRLFPSPNAVQIAAATRWADRGAGGPHVVKNYTGDIMNFAAARRACADTATREVVVADDVATDSPDSDATPEQNDGPGRRGTGATVLVEKIAGAAAARGDDLDTVAELAQRAADSSRSMAAALAPGHLPTTGRATFDLGPGEMELGVGIHGEPGRSRERAEDASSITARLLSPVAKALSLDSGDEVYLLVNGLGGTSRLELDLMYGQAVSWLDDHGVTVSRGIVGSLVTSVSMAGVSVTLMKASAEFTELLDAPTGAPAWPHRIAGAPDAGAARGAGEYRPARLDSGIGQPGDGDAPANEWLSAFIERVQGAVEPLGELDRIAGDGDFGANMSAAFGDLELPLRGDDATVLENLSRRMFVRAGGTSGAVLGTLFSQLAGADGLAEGLRRGLTEVQALGGARVGDRTLVDALAPAADAAETAETAETAEALPEIFAAARDGATGTAGLAARKGRASYIGTGTDGVLDPGAVVVAWLFGGTGQLSDFDAD